jgi:hypothetical protein
MSQDELLELLLKGYIDAIENKDIYDHGYPEARLIPANFYENCEDSVIKEAKEDISELIENKLREFM